MTVWIKVLGFWSPWNWDSEVESETLWAGRRLGAQLWPGKVVPWEGQWFAWVPWIVNAGLDQGPSKSEFPEKVN